MSGIITMSLVRDDTNSQSGTADQDVQNVISETMTHGHGKQIERDLERGSRICFQFDSEPPVG